MGLNYDLGDKSENLRRMNDFEKFNKANKKISCRKCLFFQVLYGYFGVKDWRKSNMIWDALYPDSGSQNVADPRFARD